MPAPTLAAEVLLVVLRWLHALAAIVFLGWSAVLWLDGSSGGQERTASRRFKEVVELTLLVFLATGAILTFDRLSRGAGPPHEHGQERPLHGVDARRAVPHGGAVP